MQLLKYNLISKKIKNNSSVTFLAVQYLEGLCVFYYGYESIMFNMLFHTLFFKCTRLRELFKEKYLL